MVRVVASDAAACLQKPRLSDSCLGFTLPANEFFISIKLNIDTQKKKGQYYYQYVNSRGHFLFLLINE